MYFTQKGWQVNALVHHAPQRKIDGVSYFNYDLDSTPELSFFEGADCFIHCAYAKATKGSDAMNLNIEGTKRLLETSRKAGIKKNIFISSVASKPDALSVYGKQKFTIEKLYNQQGDLIIRPGLILGNGGLFKQMRDYLKKSRFIPLISGGVQPMQTVAVTDLAQAIDLCIEKNLAGTLSVATPEKMTTKEFYNLLCKSLNTKPVFVNLPYGLLYMGLSVSETLGLTLAVSRENLLGLKKISYIDTVADLNKICISLKGCAATLNSIP